MEQDLPLEKEVRNVFAKFPPFPEGLTEFLVTIIPWAGLVLALFGILGFLTLVGVGSFITVASIGVDSYGSVWQMWIGIIGLGLAAVLYLLAFQPLRARSIKGWNLLYYAFLVNLAVNALTFQFFGLIISFLIGGWVLYQIRPKYA